MRNPAHRVASRFNAAARCNEAADRVAYRFLYARLFAAMSMDTARELLGFPPGASPSDGEVNQALRKRTLENHPDRGGDPAKMVELNVAADTLKGKAKPSRGEDPSDAGYSGYTPPARPKPEPVVVTWEDAKAKANVPSATWKFKTQNAYGGYGDSRSMAFVVVGQLDAEKYVYVAVEHYRSQNAFTGEDVDVWWMDSKTYSGSLRSVAPKAIREMHQFPHVSKKFNAKVEILPEGVVFSPKLATGSGIVNRAVSFKDAMEILGELGEEDPWKGRKIQITLQLGAKRTGEEMENLAELIINGRSHFLDRRSVEKLTAGYAKVLRLIFGDYYYFGSGTSGSKKVITKSKRGADILRWMVTNFPWEPQNIRDAMSAAADQMDGGKKGS